jgi:hypothetical protein
VLEQNAGVDAQAVREQLERLVAHPLFANSKRYPILLAYVVEQTLLGNAADLKERSIGIDVFGRAPSYDANADPVVRVTAGEVRKRLSQYYFDQSHAGELQIELPTGSYVPLFRACPPTGEIPPEVQVAAEVDEVAAPLLPNWVIWLAAGGACIVVGLVCLGIGLGYSDYRMAHRPPTATDRFWAPITGSAGTATFCLGEPAKNLDEDAIHAPESALHSKDTAPLYFRLHLSGHLALADVITLTRTAATLESQHKAFRVLPASEASFAQLREGPIILIGAFDNIWTLRLTEKLRFGFDSKNGEAVLVDRKSSQQTSWATAWDTPYLKLSRDYAIVARIHDNTTGQPVVIAAGISEEGTESAGEILYNPVYLDLLLAHAPANWDQMNMEAVIETQVIDGNPGPPKVLATEYW